MKLIKKIFSKFLKLFFLLSIIYINHSYSQTEFQYGFRIGSGTSNINLNEIKTVIDNVFYKYASENRNNMNAHFGLFSRVEKRHLFLQTELLYTYSSGSLVFSEKNTNVAFDGTLSAYGSQYFMHINLPLLVGILGEPFNFHFGPTLSYLTYKEDNYYLEESNEKISLSYVVGAEIYFNKLFFSARYGNFLTPIVKTATFMGEEFDINMKTPQFMYSIGFILGEQEVNLKKKN